MLRNYLKDSEPSLGGDHRILDIFEFLYTCDLVTDNVSWKRVKSEKRRGDDLHHDS